MKIKLKDKIKQNKGITLIALVVTIIVLLILAGISIAMLTGEGGILQNAREASDKTGRANAIEMAQLDVLEVKANNEGKISEGDFKVILDRYFTYDSEGENLPDDLSSLTLTTKDGKYNDIKASEIYNGDLEKGKKEGIKPLTELQVGDYIKYDTGVESVGENGVGTFRVLYTADSEYGLQIISNSDLEQVSLGGTTLEEAKESYNGAIVNLNKVAEKYLNTKYATDTRCVGSKPTLGASGKFTEKNSENKNTIKMLERFKNDAAIRNMYACYNVDDLENVTLAEGVEDDIGLYGEDENYKLDINRLQEIKDYDERGYWVASRVLCPDAPMETICFQIQSKWNRDYMDSDLVYVYTIWYDETSNSIKELTFAPNTRTNGFRPCIALDTNNIIITGGDGSNESNAYTIDAQ